jgi:hypothetical protein
MADFLNQANNTKTYVNPGMLTQTPNAQNPATIDITKKTTTNVAAPTYVNPNNEVTVEQRLNSLLEKDNPFLVASRTRTQQAAQARGLQNSSIAAGAGEKAAIESALPIAQQDAQYYQQKDLAGQQGEIESFLSGQSANQQAGLYNTQGQISSQLSGQESQQAQDLQKLQGKQGLDLQKLQGEQGINLQKLKGTQDMALKQADIEWNKIDLQARMDVEYDRMTEDAKKQFNDTANIIGSEYTQQLMNILSDPAFPDASSRQVAIDALNNQTMSRYRIASAAANANIYWSWGPARVTVA